MKNKMYWLKEETMRIVGWASVWRNWMWKWFLHWSKKSVWPWLKWRWLFIYQLIWRETSEHEFDSIAPARSTCPLACWQMTLLIEIQDIHKTVGMTMNRRNNHTANDLNGKRPFVCARENDFISFLSNWNHVFFKAEKITTTSISNCARIMTLSPYFSFWFSINRLFDKSYGRWLHGQYRQACLWYAFNVIHKSN